MRRGKVRFNQLDIDLVNQNTDDIGGERKRGREAIKAYRDRQMKALFETYREKG